MASKVMGGQDHVPRRVSNCFLSLYDELVALNSIFRLADDFPSLRAFLIVVPQSKDNFYRNLIFS